MPVWIKNRSLAKWKCSPTEWPFFGETYRNVFSSLNTNCAKKRHCWIPPGQACVGSPGYAAPEASGLRPLCGSCHQAVHNVPEKLLWRSLEFLMWVINTRRLRVTSCIFCNMYFQRQSKAWQDTLNMFEQWGPQIVAPQNQWIRLNKQLKAKDKAMNWIVCFYCVSRFWVALRCFYII